MSCSDSSAVIRNIYSMARASLVSITLCGTLDSFKVFPRRRELSDGYSFSEVRVFRNTATGWDAECKHPTPRHFSNKNREACGTTVCRSLRSRSSSRSKEEQPPYAVAITTNISRCIFLLVRRFLYHFVWIRRSVSSSSTPPVQIRILLGQRCIKIDLSRLFHFHYS